MKKYYYSSTRWETSNYGGFRALIWDHPEIKVSWDLEIDIKGSLDLPVYSSEKLVKIFLNKAKENNLLDYLCADPESYIKPSMFGFGRDRKMARINKSRQEKVLNAIIDKDGEYRALFEHYREIVLKADISTEINDGKSKGDGEKEDKKGSKEREGKHSEEKTNTASASLKKILSEIKKKEPISSDALTGELKKHTEWKYPKSSSNVKYTKEQESIANKFLSLLDINFDPNKDRINSLRTGKLDARKVAEILPGNLNVYYKIEENQTTKPFSVVILQDESGSMRNRMSYSVNLVKILYLAFSEILPPEKLWIYGHSGSTSPKIYVYQDPYHRDFSSSISAMEAKGENYDGPVIESIYEKVREHSDDNIIFIVLSDGQPCGEDYGGAADIKNLKRIVEKCRRDGFITVGIGIEYDTDHLYDYNCTIRDLEHDFVKRTTHLINKVVKTEFQ